MPKIIKKRAEKQSHNEDINETVTDIRQRLKQNQRTMIYAVGVFIVVIALTVGFVVYTKVNTNTAMDLEYEGYKLFYGYPDTQSIPAAERYQKALDKFKQSYSAKKRPSALIYIADCYYEMGKYDDTIKTLNDFNSRFSDSPLLALSYYKTAMAYMKKGDMDNSLKTLNSLSMIKDSPLQDMALLEAGKILDSMGKTDEAKKKFQELVTKFPKSSLLNDAKARLGGGAPQAPAAGK